MIPMEDIMNKVKLLLTFQAFFEIFTYFVQAFNDFLLVSLLV